MPHIIVLEFLDAYGMNFHLVSENPMFPWLLGNNQEILQRCPSKLARKSTQFTFHLLQFRHKIAILLVYDWKIKESCVWVFVSSLTVSFAETIISFLFLKKKIIYIDCSEWIFTNFFTQMQEDNGIVVISNMDFKDSDAEAGISALNWLLGTPWDWLGGEVMQPNEIAKVKLIHWDALYPWKMTYLSSLSFIAIATTIGHNLTLGGRDLSHCLCVCFPQKLWLLCCKWKSCIIVNFGSKFAWTFYIYVYNFEYTCTYIYIYI